MQDRTQAPQQHPMHPQTWSAGAQRESAGGRADLYRSNSFWQAGGLEMQFAVKRVARNWHVPGVACRACRSCPLALAGRAGVFRVGALAHGSALVQCGTLLWIPKDILAWVRVMLLAKSVVRALPPFLPSSALQLLHAPRHTEDTRRALPSHPRHPAITTALLHRLASVCILCIASRCPV
jgi:hypothetical protein